ncbi:response regulator [Streptomyces sp. MS06]|uniref:response regulator n=1 Tax=Streptomyces sp. MS06 TaxID=3385974 RepID=UPI0039A2EA3C
MPNLTPPVRTPLSPSPAGELRLVVADDNPVVRAGLTAVLSGCEDIAVVAEAADGREACAAAERHRPDAVLLDVRMPGMDGIAALPHLVRIAPVVMLTYSGESDVVQEALRRGAGGYLVHGEFTVDQLVAAVRDVAVGRPHLTPTAAGALLAHLRSGNGADAHTRRASPVPAKAVLPKGLSRMQFPVGQSGRCPDRSRYRLSAREGEIMDLITTGMNNRQIAAACFISEKTVKNHINRIFAKLDSASRAEATAKWLGTNPRPGDSARGLR